jgi:hypothetical protein
MIGRADMVAVNNSGAERHFAEPKTLLDLVAKVANVRPGTLVMEMLIPVRPHR